MRLGIRSKLTASFMTMMLLPIMMVIAAGSSVKSDSHQILLLIVSLVIPFAVCAAILTRLIARSILVPLDELNAATEKITAGNLDFTVAYRKNNEMGDFCAAFDLMRQKLKDSLEKQAAFENSRKELIASISHDLRTPITSIKGYVEGLQDGITHDQAKFNRYISVIRNKTESLDRLIEDLFQFSQLELGHSDMQPSLQSAQNMLDKILNPIETEFTDSTVKLVVNRPFPAVIINADLDRIRQVFENLISNAKQYVGENGVITVGAEVEDAYLTLSVTDNGVGISEEDLPHVFEHFYRGEKSRSREYGGIGLGLAICKQIVENHGGVIWVESLPDVSTTFQFQLPVWS